LSLTRMMALVRSSFLRNHAVEGRSGSRKYMATDHATVKAPYTMKTACLHVNPSHSVLDEW
jgi:hypothetical protein